MHIIPVIDIKAGQAVLARQGQRHNYRPLCTPLCSSSHIDEVINAYLGIYSFTHFYLADLDALMQTGSNHDLINSIVDHYQHLNFIIDSGLLKPDKIQKQSRHFTLVIGTESIVEHDLSQLKQHSDNFILSLDFSSQDKLMGESQLYTSSKLWPRQLIIMTLGLVGKNSGPDLVKLVHFRQNYPQHDFIAAGGIRHKQDLLQLMEVGIKTALVASALHNGSLTDQDIQQLSVIT